MRSLALTLLLFAFGCEAIFTDLSPPPDGDISLDAATDSSVPDSNTADAGPNTGPSTDVGPDMDSGPVPVDAGPSSPVLLGSGTFEGRGGYPASGSVRLEQLAAGEYQVVVSDDFSSAAVPGPVILVTPRDAIGTRLSAEDINVTALSAEQIAGAGTYTFSAGSVPDDAYIFIYCEPFGVETARAELVAP